MSGSRAGSGSKAAKATYVDEALFGSDKQTASTKVASSRSKTLGSGTKGTTSTQRSHLEVITIPKDQLTRMLKPSIVLSPEDVAAQRREQQQKREAAQAVSQARKERMLKLAEEAKRKAPETETERLKAAANGRIKSRAEYLLEEQEDEVKHMNQMVLYSKCVTIRDAQIEEKKRMMLEAEEEARRQDLAMEIERIKALEQYEAREAQRVEERRKGARVLEEQIAERERERIRQEELRDQERAIMLRELERMKEEELTAAVEKKMAAAALMKEVAAANSEQIKRKELLKVREKEEDAKILEYIRAKEIREAEVAAEKERIAREKELETARLRALQERAADKAAELDELRARRYQEAKEREWRAKERASAERAAAMQAELARAREAQKAAKIKQRAEMAAVEQQEFTRVLTVNRAKEAEDIALQATQRQVQDRYKEELQAQILANAEARKHEREAYLEEGRRIRQLAEAEQRRLQEIKERKLAQLAEMGVPEKYRAELEKHRVCAV